MRRFKRDERGVSISVGYVLTLAIVAILLSGLVAASGSILDQQTEATVENELEIIGQQVASELSNADRHVRAGDTTELVIRSELPRRTAGASYTLNITSDELLLETSDPDVTVQVPYRTETDVAEGSVSGGNIHIVYDDNADELEVVSA